MDRLAHWSPGNVAAARELVLAYHDVFMLESNELGCTSTIEHKIRREQRAFQGAVSAYTPTLVRGGAHFTQGYAGSRSDSSEPITVVQCRGLGPEEGWYSVLLCRFQMPQHVDEGFVPFAPHSGGIGKHGGVGTFLINGFQVRLLANQDGSGITTIHGLHSG